MRTSSGREGGNCIAVVAWGHLAKENAPPSAAFFGGDGELERGLAGGVTEDRGAGKQPPAQRREFGALGLAESALVVAGAAAQALPGSRTLTTQDEPDADTVQLLFNTVDVPLLTK